MFTYHYAQPEEYRFSLDSIYFAEYVAEQLTNYTASNLSTMRVLDLCAGSGVIGIELSWYVRDLRDIDFVEVQTIYQPYFQQNITTVNRPELKLNWHNLNYDSLMEPAWKSQYDLIVSNPPYFQSQQGMLSPSEFKNRCRFFIDSTFTNFILSMANVISSNGEAYFLLRCLKQHGKNMFAEVENILADTDLAPQVVKNIRGTNVVRLKKR